MTTAPLPKIVESTIKDAQVPQMGIHEYIIQKVKHWATEKKDFVTEFETGKTFSYEQYLDDVLRLANALKKLDFKPGEPFIIYGGNCYEQVLCLLAGLLLGGIGFVVRPQDTCCEVEYQIREREVKHLFVINYYRDVACTIRGNQKGLKNVLLFAAETQRENLKSVRELIQLEKDRLKEEEIHKIAYAKETVAMYVESSGTSGPCKICMLAHYSLLLPTALGIAKFPSIPLCTPLAHISGIMVYGQVINNGSRMITTGSMEAERIVDIVNKYKLPCFFTSAGNVTALAKMEPKPEMPSLILTFCAGSILHSSVATIFYDKFKVKKLMGFYTMTEVVTLIASTSGDPEQFNCTGRVGPLTKIKIVDPATGEILPVGKHGEILVKGPCMFMGYHKDAAATKAMFDSDGWLRTGDIGYFDENDLLYVTDRKKDFVEQDGWRFPPADIERILLSHHAVKDAAVCGGRIGNETPKAHAFVILKEDNHCKVKEDELRAFVNNQISQSKQLKGRIMFVADFPRTHSGKVKRRQLWEEHFPNIQGSK